MEKTTNKLTQVGSRKNTRIIFAVDISREFSRSSGMDIMMDLLKLFNSVNKYVAGIKIGLPTLLSAGSETLYRLLNEYDWDTYFIADLKLADIAYVNKLNVRRLFEIGFDAAIIHSFIGGEGGLKETVDEARDIGIDLISVVAMSHPGAEEFINRNFEDMLKLTMDCGIESIVLPATNTEYIQLARELGFKGLILSPGVGAQGAKPGSAIKAGADFEIIGRLIYNAENPGAAAKKLSMLLNWGVKND